MILEFSNHVQTTSRPEKPVCTNFQPSTPILKFGRNLLPTLGFAHELLSFQKNPPFCFLPVSQPPSEIRSLWYVVRVPTHQFYTH